MSNIPTAEEFSKKYSRLRSSMAISDLTSCMIEFAKFHVEAALKQASKRYLHDETHTSDSPDFLKDSILNSYPLENIK